MTSSHADDAPVIPAGMVVFRRRSAGRNFVRALELPGALSRPAGAHALRLFEGHDLVRALPGRSAVLDLPLALAEDATMDQRSVYSGGRLETERTRIGLRVAPGF